MTDNCAPMHETLSPASPHPATHLSLLGEIHNTQHRMPPILEKADREAWLTGTPEEAWETLAPYPDDLMVAWPVSTRINTPKNNDAQLIEPS